MKQSIKSFIIGILIAFLFGLLDFTLKSIYNNFKYINQLKYEKID